MDTAASIKALLDAMADATLLVDRDGHIVVANQRADRLFGYTQDDLTGLIVEALIPERFRPRHPELRSSFFADPEPRPMAATRDLAGRRSDGTEFPVEVSLSPIDIDGSQMAVCTVVDITERLAAAQERERLLTLTHETDQRFRQLAENIDQVFWLTDIGTWDVVYVSSKYEAIWGRTPESLFANSHDWIAAIHSDDRERVEQEFAAGCLEGTYDSQFRIVRPDGEVRWIHDRGFPVVDAHGDVVRMAGVATDITETRRTQQLAEQLGHLVEESTSGVYIFDAETLKFLQVNRGARENLGYSLEELQQITSVDLKPEMTWDDVQATLKPLRTGEQAVVELTTTHARKDRSRYPVALRIQTGRFMGRDVFITMSQDVSERRRIETELRASNAELEAFCYSVSHDLRTPLRHISGFSRAVIEDYADQLDGDGRHMLQTIDSAASRMGQLIDDMLVLSRLTRAELKLEAVDLAELAREIAEELTAKAPERRVDFTIVPSAVVQGDRGLLRLMMFNLLENSFKYTGAAPRAVIEFRMDEYSAGTVYSVADNGAGFDMRFKDKLLTAFQRLHSVNEFPGTGIGLAIVDRIARRHGGQVWADSVEGQGATFCFTIGDNPATGTQLPPIEHQQNRDRQETL